MAFVNRTRLPFKITRPQFTENRDIFTKSNGVIKVLNAVIRKRYEGETDHWPEKLHERFKIALSHDNVTIEGEKYLGGVVQDGDYQINWVDFLDYPLAKAQFFVFVTPFDANNSNCGGCEDFVQVVAEDDIIPYDVPEDFQISMGPLDNDSICCSPVQLTVVTANPDYVASIQVVEATNSIVINTKAEFASQNNVILASYRVQCANGQYDEANIIANMVGSTPAVCESAVNLNIAAISTTAIAFDWDAPTNPPANYEWELYESSDLGVPVQTGTTVDTEVNLGDLTPGTGYRFYVRSACGGDSFSAWQYIDTQTDTEDAPPVCGRYRVRVTVSFLTFYSYYDCNGDQQSAMAPYSHYDEVCMLQSSPGTPVYFQANQFVTIEYVGPCT